VLGKGQNLLHDGVNLRGWELYAISAVGHVLAGVQDGGMTRDPIRTNAAPSSVAGLRGSRSRGAGCPEPSLFHLAQSPAPGGRTS
jgi:hypothetical protein